MSLNFPSSEGCRDKNHVTVFADLGKFFERRTCDPEPRLAEDLCVQKDTLSFEQFGHLVVFDTFVKQTQDFIKKIAATSIHSCLRLKLLGYL